MAICRKRGPAKTMQILRKQRTIFNKNFQVISGFICELKLLSSNTNYRNANLLTKTQKKFQIHGQKVLKNATRGYPMRKMAERKCGVITWNSKDATLKPNAIF